MPLAVIGLSCRLPGTATSPEKLWETLATARSAWTSNAGDRFDMDQFYHPDIGKPGTLFAQGAHFLKEDVSLFDRNFFNINAVEAGAMDPQSRLVLEIAFETFENAGYSIDKIAGSDTGVYVGCWSHDYQMHLSRDPENAPAYESTGTSGAVVSNRISYFFDLKGPSLTVDTACSASLVALHQAVLSLRSGETKQCFVAGVNLLLDPTSFMALGRMRLLSPQGRCYTFDERAGGYGRGEGVGGVLIKPLDAAIRDGDSIRAIIRNTAVNQDGKTTGLTVPSAAAQEAAIRKAYMQAGLELEADYVEAHGTGTAVGDPIEAQAIAATLSANRSKDNPLIVGSMKTNIGHLEAAAGIASLIKGVLMLEKGAIPPNTNFTTASKNVGLDSLHLKVPQKLQVCDNLRRISINCFGFGGTNAHVVLEKGTSSSSLQNRSVSTNGHTNCHSDPEHYPATPSSVERDHLFVLSGHSESACRKVAANLTQYSTKLIASDQLDGILNDLVFSLTQRSALRYRIAFTCRDGEELIEKLESVQSRDIEPQLSLPNPRLAFVFTGQGAQWYGMGRELLESCPAFQDSIRQASSTLAKLGCAWDLHTELLQSAETSRVDNPAVGQPLCTAIQVSLVDALRSLGVRPKAVVGHSSGEIAAAYVAGAVSLEDAIAISYHRGRLVESHIKMSEGKGAMLAVGESPERVNKLIAEVSDHLGSMVAACINSPRSVTVSGDKGAVEQLRQNLDREEVFNRLLKTNGAAYHSHHMRHLAQEYLDAISHIEGRLSDPAVRWVSSVTGGDIGSEVVGPKYWVDNLVSPVLFSQAVEKTCLDQTMSHPLRIDTIVEIGPHSTLAGPIKQILKSLGPEAREAVYANALTRDQDANTTLLNMLGTLFVRGQPIDMIAMSTLLGEAQGKLLTDLPNYAWDHDTKYWHESRLSSEYQNRKFTRHELLGVRSPNFNVLEPSWRNYVRLSEIPWLKGHEIQGQVIWPGAAYVAMALEAARQNAAIRDPSRAPSKYMLRDVVFSKALVIDAAAEDVELDFTLRPLPRSVRESSSIWDEFRVFSVKSRTQWQEHCRGLVAVQLDSQSTEVQSSEREMAAKLVQTVSEVKARSQTSIAPDKFYSSFQQVGINWYDAFGNLTSISAGPSSSICTIRPVPTHQTPAVGYEIPYLIHPGTLDSCFQASFARMMVDRPCTPNVVTFIEKLELSPNPNCHDSVELPVYCQSSGANHNIGTFPTDVAQSNLPFSLSIEKFQLTELPNDNVSNSRIQQLCTNLVWEPTESSSHPELGQPNSTEQPGGIRQPNGTDQPNGTEQPNGTTHLDLELVQPNDAEQINGISLSNGTAHLDLELGQRNSTKQSNGISHSNGTAYLDLELGQPNGTEHQPNGVEQPNGIEKPNGVEQPNGVAQPNGVEQSNGSEHQVNGTEHPNGISHSNGTAYLDHAGRAAGLDRVEIIHHGASLLARDCASKLHERLDHADCPVSSLEQGLFTDNICIFLSFEDESFLSSLQESEFDCLKKMMLSAEGVLWVTAGATVECSNPSAATITGFARTLRVENPHLRLATLDLDPQDLNIEHATKLISTILEGPCFASGGNLDGVDFEFADRGGILHVPRIIANEEISQSLSDNATTSNTKDAAFFQEGRPLVLEAQQPGLLDTLRWIDDLERTRPGADEVCLEARAFGVNFRDLLVAVGQLAGSTMAGECSGIVTAVGANLENAFKIGDRVCAFGAQPYASYPVVKGHMCFKIPEQMTFEVAASLPIVYSTVVYALIHIGQLQRGQKVLIHSATGGVGQAAVMLAQHLGAEIFATVGTAEKKQFLISEFGLPADHIFSSRTTAFREGILRMTDNQGVDVVLNSLTGEQFRESCNCMASFGRFIEIGKRDLLANAKMDMGFFVKNITFSSIDLMLVGQLKPSLTMQLMKESVELVSGGLVKPVKIASAPLSEVVDVFRQMQAGKHMGKFVLTADADTQVRVVPPPPKRAQFDENSSYLIVGGLGGLGQTLISWMADLGARNLVTVSRSGLDNPKAMSMVDEMKSRGVVLTVLKCDVADSKQLEHALQSIETTIPPIRGVIQAAMVLQDSIFENMTFAQWQAATHPKIQGTFNLHNLLLSERLDFFITLSSIVSILGNSGQAAYAAGNSFLDALARYRTSINLPSHTINVGVVSDAGFVSENAKVAASLSSKGFSTIEVADLLNILNYAITHPMAATPALSQTCVGLGVSPTVLKDPKFKHWLEIHGGEAATESTGQRGGSDNHVNGLRNASSIEEASEIATMAILQQLSKLLMVPKEGLSASCTLMSYGVDSLISVELRNWIRAELKANVQLLEMNDTGKSIRDMAGLVAGRSKFVQLK